MGKKILLTGVTGFIGRHLLPALIENGYSVRCLVRDVQTLQFQSPLESEVEIVHGDLLKPHTLDSAFEGVDTAYYLVHSMGRKKSSRNIEFAEQDRTAARFFLKVAESKKINRVVYLGGLGETGANLSPHLKSRQEVAHILQSGDVKTTVFRAAIIIGAGGASFELIRYLVERLPIIPCPARITTKSQPICIYNVIEYLVECLKHPETVGETFDIGGEKILSYSDLLKLYSQVRRLKRSIFLIPGLPPRFTAFLLSLLTPVPPCIIYPLMEGLKNSMVCRENRIRKIIPLSLVGMEQAICIALNEVKKGPGHLPSTQACFR